MKAAIFGTIFAFLFVIPVTIMAQCQAGFTYTVTANKLFVTDNSSGVPSGTRDWDFGDGFSQTVGYPLSSYEHAYSSPGTYQVCLKVTDSTSTCVDSVCMNILVHSACHAEFKVEFPNPMLAWFTTNSGTGGTRPYSQLWDGRGFYTAYLSGQPIPSGIIPHQFGNWITSTSGTFYPYHVISDTTSNCRDTAYLSYTLFGNNGNCHASFTYVDSGNSVTFTDSSSTSSNARGYYWNFNANLASPPEQWNTSPNQTITHVYPGNGSYKACFTVVDSATSCLAQECQTIVLGPPVANAQFHHFYYNGGYEFRLTANSSYGYKFLWDFGDGTKDSTSYAPRKVYNPGSYIVCLSIEDTVTFLRDTFCVVINAGGPQPSNCASFASSVNGSNVTFTNTSSCQNQDTYYWDFGDGNYGQGPTVGHTYAASGIYNVSLVVYDSIYFIDSAFASVGISTPSNPSCRAYFVMEQAKDSLNNLIPGHIVITDSSTGTNLSHYWSFGDGNYSNLAAPSHTYSGNGPYVLCLTVSDSSCIDTYCDTLSVDSNGIISKSATGFTIHVGGYNPGTGIHEKEAMEMNLFPNPFHNEINIEVSGISDGKVEFYLFDSMGKMVFLKEFHDVANSTTLILDPGDLPHGVYFVQMKTDNGTIMKKMIKN